MATEAPAEPSPTLKESAKIVVPTEEEEKLDKKELILMILGYTSLVFALVSLFFPLWNDNTVAPTNFVSSWRITISGTPYYHWDIFWLWQTQLYQKYIFPSAFFLAMSIIVIGFIVKSVWKLVMHDWKQ